MTCETKITFEAIGIVHSPHTTLEGMPIQPAAAVGIRGKVELFPQYREGLLDLDGFSPLILLYHFHKSNGYRLKVVPYLDTVEHGVFATRAPRRPNAIGMSVVRLLGMEGGVLEIENVDILDGTPLLDIKPYVTDCDRQADVRVGWLQKCEGAVADRRSDGRFC